MAHYVLWRNMNWIFLLFSAVCSHMSILKHGDVAGDCVETFLDVEKSFRANYLIC